MAAIKSRKGRTSKNSNKTAQAEARARHIAATAGAPLQGNIIAWRPGAGPHKHVNVLAALTTAGLDTKPARELLPQHAFTRALRKMSDERIINVLREDGNEITFQFSRIENDRTEIRYPTEALVTLNKVTGQVRSDHRALQQDAQHRLAVATEDRTTADISNIVQKLCEDRGADLIPLRDQGGCYFVPAEHTDFVLQIKGFIEALGGKMNPWPIATGTAQSTATVAEAVGDYLAGLITAHEAAVSEFGTDTRPSTLERCAADVRNTRVKLEAYAHYLGEQRDALLAAHEEAKTKLEAKVQEITAERATMTDKGESRVCRCKIFGHPVSGLTRWMAGVKGWNYDQIRKVLDHYGAAEVKPHSVKAQMGLGIRKQLPIPEVSRSDAAALTAIATAE